MKNGASSVRVTPASKRRKESGPSAAYAARPLDGRPNFAAFRSSGTRTPRHACLARPVRVSHGGARNPNEAS